MLTPQQVDEYRKKYGISTSTTTSSDSSLSPRMQRLTAIASQSDTRSNLLDKGNSTTISLNPTGAAHQAMREQMAKDRGIPLVENDTRSGGSQSLIKNLFGTTKVENGRLVPDIQSSFPDAAKQVGEQYKTAFNNSANELSNAMLGNESPLVAGAQTFSNFTEPTIDVYNKILSPLGKLDPTQYLNPVVDFLSGKTKGTTDKNQQENTQQISDLYKVWAEKHPDAAKELHGVSNAVQLGALVAGGEDLVNNAGAIKNTTNSLIDSAKPVLESAKNTIMDTVGETTNQFKAGVQDIKNVSAAKSAAKADTITGKITQGEISDIPKTKNALSNIDIREIEKAPEGKKYQTLQQTLDNKVTELSNAKGEALSSNKNVYKLSDLTSKVGDTSHNFISDALDQLKTYYEKTNNIKGQSEINNLIKKAENQGLSIKEIDDIAIKHGKDLNAYNANGELASGLSKQSAENTRMGVKNTARDLFGDEAYKAADAQLSDTIRTRDLVKDISDKANELSQKIIKRGWGEQLGRFARKIIDTVTFGTSKGFLDTLVPRGEGLKTLNALDLDKMLVKNLKKLQGLVDSNSEAELTSRLNQAIKDNEIKGVKTYSKAEPSDLGQKPLNTNIKVNNYQSSFPKYFTKDQIDFATKMLKVLENKGKTIDMKAINQVVKQVKSMSDIKPPKSGIQYDSIKYPKELEKRLNKYGK